MKNSSLTLINLPSFIFKVYNINEKNLFSKIYILIVGKFSQIILKKTNKSLFCYSMNLLFRRYSNIKYDKINKTYTKSINKNLKINYPNKRVIRTIQNDENSIFNLLYETYCLDYITFRNGDTIIDCGANVGELNYSFYLRSLDINYIGIEPDEPTYLSLQSNKLRKTDTFYNFALSDKNGISNLYLDSFGGNSSLEYFGEKSFIEVQTKTIDSLLNPEKVKLFKVEAEGHEPEILLGASGVLKITEFVSVDFGFERGVEQKSTIKSVNEILINNNFHLVDISKHRHVGLYKNSKIS